MGKYVNNESPGVGFCLRELTLSFCSAVSGILGIVYPLLMAALLGAGDGVLMTQLNALIGMLFKHDTVSTNFFTQI